MIKIDAILTWIGQALKWFESWTGSYMVALIIFSIAVEILFLPFDIKQQKNQIMQATLQPTQPIHFVISTNTAIYFNPP